MKRETLLGVRVLRDCVRMKADLGGRLCQKGDCVTKDTFRY